MGTEACADELVKEENPISISKVAGGGIVEASNVIMLLSQSSSPPAIHSIGPLTPDSNREINRERDHEFSSSPLTASSCFNSSPDRNSSETPKETLFYSFAPPAPDNFLLSPPHYSKYREGSRIHFVRRLDFTCETNYLLRDIITSHESNMESISDDEEEHCLLEILYGTILDAIVSGQTTKELGVESGFDDGFGTPKPGAAHLCWIAETCPGAPMKPTSKHRNIDKEICKKLEF